MLRPSLALLALLVLPTLGTGQLEAGDPMPELEGTWMGEEPVALAELRGRVLIIEFFDGDSGWSDDADWPKESRRVLRELQREYASLGLYVLSVTTGDADKARQRKERWRMSWPMVLADEEALEERFALKGLDRVFVVDVAGTLAWRGNLTDLRFQFDEKRLVEMLSKSTRIPPLPERFAKLNQLLGFRSAELGKAHKEIQKALAREPECTELAAALAALEALGERGFALAARLAAERDYAGAHGQYEELAASFAGSPLADRARASRQELLRNPEAKKDVAAAEKLAEADREAQKGADDKAREMYQAILRNYAGTRSAERAALGIEALKK